MSRAPVITRVAEILESSGRTDAEVVVGFTYGALAARVYDVEEPNAAQLSAVRRAVARLVADGRAERGTERLWSISHVPWAVTLPPRRHQRRGKYGRAYTAGNPGGAVIFRTPTEDDIRAGETREANNPSPAQLVAEAAAFAARRRVT